MIDGHVLIEERLLTEEEIMEIVYHGKKVELSDQCKQKIQIAENFIKEQVEKGKIIYGVTTWFGSNSDKVISASDAGKLQENLLLSHACGVGEYFKDEFIRMALLLRILNFTKWHSGIRLEVVEFLVKLLNNGITPLVPQKWSVGSSWDLAPLSHIGIVMLGVGKVRYKNEARESKDVLEEAGMTPLKLTYKEGLAFNNGTSMMTAIAVLGMLKAKKLLKLADISASLTLECLGGRSKAYEEKVHMLRPHIGQINTAKNINRILEGSDLFGIDPTKIKGKKNVPQDSYSLRCIPQVHGASKNAYLHAKDIVHIEVGSVTDNPLIFCEEEDVISAGHFHGQPIALIMDYMKLAMAEIGSIAERRIAKLVDKNHNEGLPGFLVPKDGWLNSWFMIPQYVAAALVSENKVLVHPASSDSIPTSANIEDHVSMWTIAARQFLEIMDNVYYVIAIEIYNNCQAIDLRKRAMWDFKMGKWTQVAHNLVREKVTVLEEDRFMHPDIQNIKELIESERFVKEIENTIWEIII